MNAVEAIKVSIEMSQLVCLAFLDDLDEGEFGRRPHADCNSINFQVGHLIESEHRLINLVCPNVMPPLPQGFEATYGVPRKGQSNNGDFLSKEDLMSEFGRQRKAMLAALEQCSESDLSKDSHPSIRSYSPTIGSTFSLQASHWMMHAGQWAVVRRQLEKPIIF